jgi:hypothetical protein
MKTLKFLFSDLNQDERQILGGVVAFITGTIFMMWLVSTNTPPVLDAKKTDKQTEVKRSYELPKSYTKYAQHCYEYNN